MESWCWAALTQTTTLETLTTWTPERRANGKLPWKGKIFTSYLIQNVCAHPFRNNMCFNFHHFFHSSSVSVGTEMVFCVEGCTAVIDTGSSYITGPASSVSVLMKTIGAQLDESGVSFYTRNMVSHRKHLSVKIHYPSSPITLCCSSVQSQLWHCEDAAQYHFPPGWPGVFTHSGGLYLMGKQDDKCWNTYTLHYCFTGSFWF